MGATATSDTISQHVNQEIAKRNHNSDTHSETGADPTSETNQPMPKTPSTYTKQNPAATMMKTKDTTIKHRDTDHTNQDRTGTTHTTKGHL